MSKINERFSASKISSIVGGLGGFIGIALGGYYATKGIILGHTMLVNGTPFIDSWSSLGRDLGFCGIVIGLSAATVGIVMNKYLTNSR